MTDMCRDRLLFDLIDAVGNSLDLHLTLGELDTRLRQLVFYDSMAVWMPREDRLVAGYVSGEDAPFLCGLEIPPGQGVEECRGALGSALAIALEDGAELVAVLALYRRETEAFGGRDREVLDRIRRKAAAAIANAVRYERAERLAEVDPETSLPNRRALFLRLDAELARARRNHSTLAVLVCDFGKASVPWPAVAAGLRLICREDDCVARMGDGLVLVLGGFARPHLAEKRTRIGRLLAEHGLIATIGDAFYPGDGADAEDLLAAAGARRSREGCSDDRA